MVKHTPKECNYSKKLHVLNIFISNEEDNVENNIKISKIGNMLNISDVFLQWSIHQVKRKLEGAESMMFGEAGPLGINGNDKIIVLL